VIAAPRVAYFPDSLTEVNGVARTSQQLVSFATERALPFLCVHAGSASRTRHPSATVTRVELRRGRMSCGLERDLRFDLALWRYTGAVRAQVDAFGPDLIHITGPSDVGQLGAYLAYTMGVPLVASWHTNLHDFAESRLASALRWAPAGIRRGLPAAAGRHSLTLLIDFYKMARVLLAPNEELAGLLRRATNRPVHLMTRGVDTRLFTPLRRNRGDTDFVIGYVGRLSPEKNVRLLAALEAALVTRGAPPFRFVIVGDGSERAWLEPRMPRAEFPGVLTGEALARAYANLDVFVFPSTTDTYGNVVQEACASGVPVIVTSSGGPRFLVREGVTGFVRDDVEGQLEVVLEIMRNPARAAAMRIAARESARQASWPRVFERVYDAYDECVRGHRAAGDTGGQGRRELSWLARIVTAGLARKRRPRVAGAAAA
jgi:glycosyltransferase involved in cell wall biosynthesis